MAASSGVEAAFLKWYNLSSSAALCSSCLGAPACEALLVGRGAAFSSSSSCDEPLAPSVRGAELQAVPPPDGISSSFSSHEAVDMAEVRADGRSAPLDARAAPLPARAPALSVPPTTQLTASELATLQPAPPSVARLAVAARWCKHEAEGAALAGDCGFALIDCARSSASSSCCSCGAEWSLRVWSSLSVFPDATASPSAETLRSFFCKARTRRATSPSLPSSAAPSAAGRALSSGAALAATLLPPVAHFPSPLRSTIAGGCAPLPLDPLACPLPAWSLPARWLSRPFSSICTGAGGRAAACTSSTAPSVAISVSLLTVAAAAGRGAF
mmetsp:Transcript_20004/g.46157  ORF Transcript_20004/g.46157 Transcript_20004/m.46157 type:complete len:328 (-) Transcript_20004:699-1682(-)